MDNTAIRIVKLEPFRAASFYGFGTSPEEQAFGKLQAWAGPHGYLDDLAQHRIFGFNNPEYIRRQPELWLRVLDSRRSRRLSRKARCAS